MIELTNSEREFLKGILKTYLEYYLTLAGNTYCTPKNRQMATFIQTLYAKLSNTRN